MVDKRTDPRTSTPTFVVHGHFYQPPRENPYLLRIDRQDSAQPNHDWNERITDQCYAPNGRSRILDDSGRVEELANNFASMSHNVGPTLLTWLEDHAPAVYGRIIEGDRLARERQDGAGSAMAQNYNHIILTLADELDRETQIRWGIADFVHRYGRKPKGMWLAECAIDHRTVDALIDEGIEFVILSPNQAEEIAPLAGGPWRGVSHGEIEVHQPYRIFHSVGLGNRPHLDVLFYHAALAQGIAFGDLLLSADSFAKKARESLSGSGNRFSLVATDGESFGHHKAYGDMCLASLFHRKLPQMKIQVATPEKLLQTFKPEFQVRLKAGDEGRGTAWSCSHGIGRWYRNCGCSGGSGVGWNQEWREPLFFGVRDLCHKLKTIYYRETSPYFRDAWEARNDYVRVLLSRYDSKAQDQFLNDHLRRRAGTEVRQRLLALLESQKYSMYAQTSCGWFFDDISGIEPVQNLRYAAMAIDLAGPDSRTELHEAFIGYLKKARSNIPEHENGATIYHKWVLAHVLTPEKRLSRELLCRMARSYDRLKAPTITHRMVKFVSGHLGPKDPTLGTAEILDMTTRTKSRFHFQFTPTAPVGATCSLVPAPRDSHPEEIASFPDPISWTDLDTDLKDQLMLEGLTGESKRIGQTLSRALRDWEPILKLAAKSGAHLPHAIWSAARQAFEWEVEAHLNEDGVFPEGRISELRRLLDRSHELHIQLESTVLNTALTRTLTHMLDRLDGLVLDALNQDGPIREICKRILEILEMERRDGIEIKRAEPENQVWVLMTRTLPAWVKTLNPPSLLSKDPLRGLVTDLGRVATGFNYSPGRVKVWTAPPVTTPRPVGR